MPVVPTKDHFNFDSDSLLLLCFELFSPVLIIIVITKDFFYFFILQLWQQAFIRLPSEGVEHLPFIIVCVCVVCVCGLCVCVVCVLHQSSTQAYTR